jgi:GH25 family lysozyme M1 (1,4-beta-N-acetylmuramidase)
MKMFRVLAIVALATAALVALAVPVVTRPLSTDEPAASSGATAEHNGYPGAGRPARAPSGAANAALSLVAGLPAGHDINGIDVSSNDHSNGHPPNWAARKAGGDEFAYVKATEATDYHNPYFSTDYRTAKSAGLYVGAYAFGRPDLGDPAGQANYFANHLQWAHDGKTLPPFVDLEWPYPALDLPDCYGLSTSHMVSWISTFLTTLEKRIGVRPMIYTNVNWWNPCTDSSTAFSRYGLDISSCLPSPPSAPGWGTRWTFWQYDIPDCGRGGVHDFDVFNGNLAQLAALAGDTATGDSVTEGPVTEDPVTNLSGDVDGDGRADLVAVHDAETWVMLATGTAGAAPTRWSAVKFNGTVGNLIGDVNGDTRGDLVAVNDGDVWVMLSTGTAFDTPGRWSAVALQGTVATLIGDVDGDRRADLVAVNDADIWVMLSTGTAFATPGKWPAVSFQGPVASLR